MSTRHPAVADAASLSRADLRTLTTLFGHPLAHNLAWSDTVALFTALGRVEQHSNSEFALTLAGETQVMRKPHSKHLSTSDVIDLRHFLSRNGFAPEAAAPAAQVALPPRPTRLVVIDHRGARIFAIDVSGAEAGEHTIRPYDPHAFLQHLTHKDQSRERGQRAPEDAGYYQRIAQALAEDDTAGGIVLVGHGTGHSDAAQHLATYLRTHHAAIARRIVRELTADLSAVTEPQLLALAR